MTALSYKQLNLGREQQRRARIVLDLIKNRDCASFQFLRHESTTPFPSSRPHQ